MSKDDLGTGGKAAIVGAIGSAAVAAAMLYVTKRRERRKQRYDAPFAEQPETD